MIKAIIFDIDGVLLDSFDANIGFFQRLMKLYNYKRPTKEEAKKIFHLTMWDAIKLLTKENSEERIREIWLKGKKLDIYPTKLLKMPKDEKTVIKELGKKYKLALVTSRVKKGVEIFFKVSGLRKYFHVVVSFEDYKKPKPNPEPLLIALKRLGVKPEEAIYVGDSLTDAQAAKKVGMIFVAYKNKIKIANHIISRLKDLTKVIK
jgi:HAD superfamily hydrolase (TIGR01509 family)